jgi:uncharacterized protein (TIGR00369 family)
VRSLTISWSDPHALAQAGRSLPGLDFLRAIRDGRLPSPPIAELLGFRLVEAEPGHAVFEVLPDERHYNPIGVVHGGLAMTLLDSAMGCAVQTQVPAGATYATLEAKTNLTRRSRRRPASCARSEKSFTSAAAWRLPRDA